MKNSLNIFRSIAVVLFIALGTAAIYAGINHETQGVIECAAIAAIVAPAVLLSSSTPQNKQSNWKRYGPMICLVIATGKDYALVNPRITGQSAMPIIMNNDSGIALNSGVSTGTNFGSNSPLVNEFADFAIGRALEFQLIFGVTYAGGVIPLLPQYFSDVLPTGVTFLGTFATYATFVNYFCKFPTKFSKVTVSVDDTANFDKSLKMTKTYSDGNTNFVQRTWNSLTRDIYATDLTVRVLDANFITGADMRYELVSAVIPGSGTKTMTFTFNVVGTANNFSFIRPSTS